MRNYLIRCLEGHDGMQMCPYMGNDEFSNPRNRLPGYITCQQLKEVVSTSSLAGGAAGGGAPNGNRSNPSFSAGGSSTAASSPNGVEMQPILNICKRIYLQGHKTLTNCAFVKDLFGFQRCIKSLMEVLSFSYSSALSHFWQRVDTT